MESERQQVEEFKKELMEQAARLDPVWKSLKVSPKLAVEEGESPLFLFGLSTNLILFLSSPAMDGYMISGYIPGMRKDDVVVAVAKEGYSPILNIRGCRIPTLEELALMRRQLVKAGINPDDEAVVSLGKTRFGSFHEKYVVPKDVDSSEIQGRYEEGELVVVLPKVRLVQRPRGYGYGYDHQPQSYGFPSNSQWW